MFSPVLAHAAQPTHEPQMSWLDNGVIRLGADLNLGGAITWLSRAGDAPNVINSYDWGRQVQMSYYGGPVPFVPEGKTVAPQWLGLGWNPIQAGDHFGNRSRILEHRNDGRTLYVKCVPMQWPLDGVPGECTFESWLELDGASVRARCRLTNARADTTRFPARTQELPAVYTNGPWHRIVSYTGDKPFTNGAVSKLTAKPPPQWDHWLATENWAALLDDKDFGLGVWNPDCLRFIGGFNGKPGAGGPRDTACGYLAPVRDEILDHNIVHDYRYDLILGSLDEIRAHVYRRASKTPSSWHFENSRAGWRFHEARDAGWPIRGQLEITFDSADPQLLSPQFFVRADDAPVLVIDAAFSGASGNAQVFWSTLAEPGFMSARSAAMPVVADGEFREYRLRLADSPAYRGGVTQLRIDPPAGAGSARIRAVRLGR
jgi:hypothetical protein